MQTFRIPLGDLARRALETVALVAPLLMGCLYLVAAVVLPFGGAFEQGESSVHMAAVLFVLSAAVGLHLMRRNTITSIIGILCAGIALIVISYTFARHQLLGSAGYWQAFAVPVLSAMFCGWHLRESRQARTDPF